MVTKKTRLLSAIMAVMMLVTLFTGIVLPASAVTVPDLPTMTEYHNSVKAGAPLTGKEFTVATLAELELVSLYQATLNEEYTIYFIDDIAIPTTGYVAGQASGTSGDANAMSSLQATLDGGYAEGGMAKLSGIRVAQNWLGTYDYGKAIRNLHFYDCQATGTGNGGALVFGANGKTTVKTFENIKMTKCVVTKGGTGSNNLSLFCGKTNGAASIFRNFWVEECSMIDHTNYTGGPCNYGFLMAAAQYSVTLENIYMLNNVIDIDWLDNSHGVVVGELTQKNADVFFSAKNIAVFGTTLDVAYEGKYDGSVGLAGMNSTLGVVAGAVASYTKKTDGPAVTLDNIIAYDNNRGNCSYLSVISGQSLAEDGSDIMVKATNISTDLPKIVRDTIYSNQSTNKSYCSAYVQKLTADSANNVVNGNGADLFAEALRLNKAGVQTKWAWDGEKPVLSNAQYQEILEVVVKILDPKTKEEVAVYSDYTDAAGKLMNPEDYADKALYWEADPATAVIKKENPVLLGYVLPAHEHVYEYTDKGNGTHDFKCTFSYTDGENEFVCDKAGNAVHETTVYKNITATNTATPASSHYAVPACKYCSFVDSSAPSVRHTTLVKDEEKSVSATCTETGIAVMYCEECDYVHTGVEAIKEHSWTRFEQIDGYNNHKTLCEYCDAAKDSLDACVFEEWEETKAPTIYEEGEAVSACVCGKEKTKTLPKLAGLEINAEKAKVGNEFKVEIDLKNNPGVGGMNLELTYDADALELKGSEAGDWEILFVPDGIPGTTGIVKKNMHIVSDADMEGDGTVLVLTFEVKNDEELLTGTNTAVSVKAVNAFSYEDLDEAVELEGVTKEIYLNSGLTKGDMTGDTMVDLQDAIYLLRYLNKPEGSPSSYEVAPGVVITEKMANLTSANDNQDLGDGTTTGTVNMNDVIHLLQYLNFQITDEEFFGV